MHKVILTIFIALMATACKRNNAEDVYAKWNPATRGKSAEDSLIDPNTIQGLHKNIFKPTCANSGCHDGNFEPDFRSIESAYNSLVNRWATNTDPNNSTIKKRVVPGDADASMVFHRLTVFIPGSQGIMPLSLEPNSDWTSKKSEYIQNIKTWINNGAKDQFGNSPSAIDFTPQILGMIAFADGSATPISQANFNPIDIPAGTTNLKIMIAFSDDKTSVNALTNSSINYTLNPYQYNDSTKLSLITESTPTIAKGYNNTNVSYWHSITLPVSKLGTLNDVIWLQTYTSDNVNGITMLPGLNSEFKLKKYFAIKIN